MCYRKCLLRLLPNYENYKRLYFQVLESFFFNASVCTGVEINLPESSQARAELTSLCKVMAEDGVSLMARDVKLDKIVGVAFSKIQVCYHLYDELSSESELKFSFFQKVKSNSGEESDYFVNRTRNTQSDSGKALLQIMKEVDRAFDCYKYFETDCIFDLSFLSTLIPGYEKKSIGKMLSLYSMQLATELAEGKGLELLPENLRNYRPGAITAVFSSNYSKKIGQDLGFETLHEAFFTEFSYKGKTLAERITGGHQSMTVAGKKL